MASGLGLDCRSLHVLVGEKENECVVTTADLSTPMAVVLSFGWDVIYFQILEDQVTQPQPSIEKCIQCVDVCFKATALPSQEAGAPR